MSLTAYREKLRSLSEQLVAIQKPILILDALKWPANAQKTFLDGGGDALPAVDADYYHRLGVNFSPGDVRQKLKDLEQQVRAGLGKNDALGRILCQNIDQYRLVVDLLQARGTPAFMDLSQRLYGSATDHLLGDRKTLLELGERLCHIFSLPAVDHLARGYPKTIAPAAAVTELQTRLDTYFGSNVLNVREDDGIVADAAAGGDTIKINSRSKFSTLDIQMLEVHEGWVHVGTTLNGRRQPWLTWLSVGSPRITAIQEGLAVLVETLTFSSYPVRARKISDRVKAVALAESGADFIEVYRYFVEQSYTPEDSYRITQRVFRGGMVSGGACFTKDISYVRGFTETVNFIRSAILSGVPEVLPMLFIGKVTLDDIPTLYEHSREGTVTMPAYLPPMFRDLNGIYTWFGFSSGMALVDLGRVQRHFNKLFAQLT